MLRVVSFLLFLLISSAAHADSYLDQLKFQAKTKSLSTQTAWQALLHYAPHYLGIKNKGEVDGGDFYLSPEGKYDPEAELNATLENFFRTDVSSDDHPQCRFVARYEWLKHELDFDPAKIAEQECPRFKEWLGNLNPEKATVIFPAAYLNNPSSMFGHTLLRIDPVGQSKDEHLTSYGVNYGANTPETQGLLFAIKGIFGGYPGGFTIAPFYTQVLDYSEIENRDIWEYETSLMPHEVKRLVMHLWELRGVTFDYYFFDENCSYHLLSLLESARPDSKLRSKAGIAVVPVDSVRVMLLNIGMIKKAEFRPSNKKILDERFRQLPEHEKLIAKHIGTHDKNALLELSELEQSLQAKVLDTGIDLLTYRTYKQPDLIKEEEGYKFELYKLRSKLPALPDDVSVPPPPRPDLGHFTNRATFAVGTHNKKAFYEVAFRPAYHDLLDPDSGYTKGAQIQFLGTKFRHTEEDDFKLEKLDVLDILSLSPWDEVFHGISWNVWTGLERMDFGNNQRSLTYDFNVGAGIAVEPTENSMLFFLAGPQFLWSRELDDAANLGLGPTLGGIWDANKRVKLLLQASGGEYFVGSDFRSFKASAEARYVYDRNLAFRASVERRLNFADEKNFENWSSTAILSIMTYF